MNDNLSILVHGYTLVAQSSAIRGDDIGKREWKHVVWGDVEKQKLGRIAKGVLLALKHHAKMLIIGTGASCLYEDNPITYNKWTFLGKPSNVVWEAEYIFNDVINNFDVLNHYAEIKNVISSFGGTAKAKRYIERISIKDTKSRNTDEELCNALRLCNNKKIETLLSVSNLSHVPRCVLVAFKEMKEMKYENYFLPTPCDTDFSDSNEVLIFEPQSGPGPKQTLHPTNILKVYFNLSEELKYKFLNECKNFFIDHLNNTDT